MAVTKTPRLNLAKQDFQDPGWDVALDQGFDDADARFFKTSIGEGPYIGIAQFTGAGLNDMTTSGAYTDSFPRMYVVEIDGVGSPNTFKWSNDGGLTFGATGVPITGAAQLLEDGVSVTFGATTGHTLGNRWTFGATESVRNPDNKGGNDGRAVVADYVGQRYLAMAETPESQVWYAEVAGDAATAVWKRIGTPYNHILQGLFRWTSVTQVTFQRVDGAIRVGFNDATVGEFLLEKTDADLVLDITTDLESGHTEDPDTWYYAYIGYEDNVHRNYSRAPLTKLLSKTAPAGGKHPTKPKFRFVGEVYNDSASNFRLFPWPKFYPLRSAVASAISNSPQSLTLAFATYLSVPVAVLNCVSGMIWVSIEAGNSNTSNNRTISLQVVRDSDLAVLISETFILGPGAVLPFYIGVSLSQYLAGAAFADPLDATETFHLSLATSSTTGGGNIVRTMTMMVQSNNEMRA